MVLVGGTPENLRNLLLQYQVTDSILGAVLVGDLPQAWFELYEDFDNNGLPDPPGVQVQFPCDLYYMDLDGDWYDGDLDGVPDTHMNAWQPDIFVGRLLASTVGSEVFLLRTYLDRNHAFRMGQLFLPGRGLAYIDDDWSGGAGQWAAAFGQAAGLVDLVNHPDSTTAADYTARLDDGYYAYLLAAHSSPELHSFKEQGGTTWNAVFNFQIMNADPDAFFYNLFCCSACRYNENQYIGGCYLFAPTWAMGVLGSTKTGSMLYFEDYYPVMDQGECVGEAFRHWLALHGQEPGSVMWAMSWFYGMTHLGDPTLFMQVGLQVAEATVIDDGTAGSVGDGDGIPDAGERIALNLTLINHDPAAHDGMWVKLSSNAAFATWLADSVYVGTVPAQGTATANGFLADLAAGTADNMPWTIGAVIRNAAQLWGDSFTLAVRAPRLVLTGFEREEIFGNGDPIADPGESFGLRLTIQNQGGDDCPAVSLAMTSYSPWVQVALLTSGLPALAPGATGTSDPAVGVEVSPDCPANHAAVLKATITDPPAQPRLLFQVGNQLAWVDSVTSPDELMVHYAVAGGYNDQWHPSIARFASPPYAFKFGHMGSLNYAPQSDGALETPLFRLGDVAELRFQHWLESERGYDGGIVELDAGGGWQGITPQGGYPSSTQSNGSFPGGPAYSGSSDWSEAAFNLAGYAGFARLRFRFGSDGGIEEEGWYLDDVRLAGDLFSGADSQESATPAPAIFHLSAAHPNPFNPTTAISFQLTAYSYISLRLYDTAGREVRTLEEGWRAAGSHQTTLDGTGLASGIYLLRLETGESAQTRKLVLMN
jgi:hypothetical protein